MTAAVLAALAITAAVAAALASLGAPPKAIPVRARRRGHGPGNGR